MDLPQSTLMSHGMTPKAHQEKTCDKPQCTCSFEASQVELVVKNLPASAGDLRGVGSIPGLGRSPGGGHGSAHSSILAWRISRTEEPGSLWSIGSQTVGRD